MSNRPQPPKRKKGGPDKLADSDARFLRYFFETGNATEAEARTTKSTMGRSAISSNAKRRMKKPAVKRKIAELRVELARRYQISSERVLAEYARLGFANMLDYIKVNEDGTAHLDLSKLTRDQAAAISEMTFETVLSSDPNALEAAGIKHGGDGRPPKVRVLKAKFRLHDKKGALSDLGKHLGMFKADNEQAGKAAGEAIAAVAGPRDLARAVLDILREAKLEGAEG